MRKAFVWTTSLLLGVAIVPGILGESSRSGSTNPAAANTAAQTKKRITVPAGTRILIRMVDSIDSTKQTRGYASPLPWKPTCKPKTPSLRHEVRRCTDGWRRLRRPAGCPEVPD